MCTVTFVRSGDNIFLTSNRDEQVSRLAQPPQFYRVGTKQIIFPKDPRAGGTWFAADDCGNAAVLLNGAEHKHKWNPPYRKSRGLVLLEVLSADNATGYWESLDLNGIEPFTLVLLFYSRLYQLQWDEISRTCIELDHNAPHIWSSSTLYSDQVRQRRKTEFNSFVNEETITSSAMIRFHKHHLFRDDGNALKGMLKTTSISQLVIEEKRRLLKYIDLESNFESEHELPLR